LELFRRICGNGTETAQFLTGGHVPNNKRRIEMATTPETPTPNVPEVPPGNPPPSPTPPSPNPVPPSAPPPSV
jgi:hypothetical protein